MSDRYSLGNNGQNVSHLDRIDGSPLSRFPKVVSLVLSILRKNSHELDPGALV